MTTPPKNPKRWRPRFSVRTLVVLVTMVCAYAACWGPTMNRGLDDVATIATSDVDWDFGAVTNLLTTGELDLSFDVEAKLPLVVAVTHANHTRYYFWFFGYVARLPYERELPSDL